MDKKQNKKYKVLLVDDDKFLVDMYSLKFRDNGLEVDAVFGGAEALEKVKENDTFDIILLDLIMPVMDGFEFLDHIKAEGLAKNSAVIILSNQGQKSDLDKAEKYNVDGYIIKASTIPSEVLSTVLKIADRKFNN